MHLNCEKNLIGIEINSKLGFSSVEIEENKIISSGHLAYWMFDIVY